MESRDTSVIFTHFFETTRTLTRVQAASKRRTPQGQLVEDVLARTAQASASGNPTPIHARAARTAPLYGSSSCAICTALRAAPLRI